MSLGSMITKARKDAGLSIDDLSAATNIRVPLLRQMESDNFSQCGGETYARGHLRNIATKLNVDEQIFLTAFEDEQMHVDRSMQDLLVENNVMREPREGRKVSWKVLVAISISTLFIAGFAQFFISNDSTPDIPVALEETAAPTAEPTAEPTVEPTAEPTINEEAEPTDEPVISTGEGVEVIITATRGRSWLFVSDSTGRALFSGQISRGASRTFTASEQLNLKVGNAGGVDLTVNGKKLDPIGVDGQVVSVSYGVDS
jgi:cytoskeleton protein RodZ